MSAESLIKNKPKDGKLFKQLEEILAKNHDIKTVETIMKEYSYALITFLTYSRSDYEKIISSTVPNLKEDVLKEYDSSVMVLNTCKEIAPNYVKEKFIQCCLPENVERMIY